MSLRSKIAAILTAVMLVLMALFAIVFSHTTGATFAQLEADDLARNLGRLEQAIHRETDSIDVLARDWAEWDDTYRFAQDGNEAYQDSNLVEELPVTLKMNLIAILGRDGMARYRVAVDFDGSEIGHDLVVDDIPEQGVRPDSPLLRHGDKAAPFAGLMLTSAGPMLISARPILSSERQGPAAGTLIMGRLLSGNVVQAIDRTVQHSVRFWPFEQAPAKDQAAWSDIVQGGPPWRYLEEGIALAYTALPALKLSGSDQADNGLILFRIEIPRQLDRARTVMLRDGLGLAGASGLVVLVVVLLLMEAQIVRPLLFLSDQISRLRATPKQEELPHPGHLALGHLALDRRDELGDLAEAFDSLLIELAQAADDRAQAHDRLVDGVEGIADGFALWGPDERLVLLNGRYRTFFPESVATCIQPGIAFPDFARMAVQGGAYDIPSGSEEDWLQRRFVYRANPGQPLKQRLTDGRWVEVRERRTRDGGIVGIYTDITAQTLAETDLKVMVGELKRSNDELEQFAYVASHDLQEPLRMVASYTQLLERRYKGRLDDDADEFIHYAVDGAKRMQSQINDLLAYSRVDRMGNPFEPVKAENAVQAALANLRAAIAETQAEIDWDPLPVTMADPGQLTQLFQNLIGNAIKYHRADVIPKVHISVGIDDGWADFVVADNGIGIDKKAWDRIFMIFQRLHTRETYPGTGIGLAICKKIVERHGGTIDLVSTPGEGSSFRFRLPLAAPAETDKEVVMV